MHSYSRGEKTPDEPPWSKQVRVGAPPYPSSQIPTNNENYSNKTKQRNKDIWKKK